MGVTYALLAALAWGGGDFSGGLASRGDGPFRVLARAAVAGLVLATLGALAFGEPFPGGRDAAWALAGGAAGALGVVALYRGFAIGRIAVVAPLAAVIGAAVPLFVEVAESGWPGATATAGLGLALVGIWLVTGVGKKDGGADLESIGLATLAGLGFGAFFVFMGRLETDGALWPTAIARSAWVVVGFARVASQGHLRELVRHRNPMAWWAGALDAAGNVFYVLAAGATRLDVAAVLSSLYPAFTVLLARVVLREDLTGGQIAGLALCFAAVALLV